MLAHAPIVRLEETLAQVEADGGPWPEWAACCDLQAYLSSAIEGAPWPSTRTLAARWDWHVAAAHRLVEAPDRWCGSAALVEAWRALRADRRAELPPKPPTTTQPTDLPPELPGWLIVRLVRRMMVLDPEYVALRRLGHERDDIAQDIALQVVHRQRAGAGSRYRPERGSVEAYVRTVSRSTMRNMLETRVQPRPLLEMDLLTPDTDRDDLGDIDPGHFANGVARSTARCRSRESPLAFLLHGEQPDPWGKPAGWKPTSKSTLKRRARAERAA